MADTLICRITPGAHPVQKIAPEDWKQLFELLDTALELPPDQQQAWLDTLDSSRAALKPALLELLSKRASVQTNEALSALPRFTEVGEAVHPGALPRAGDLVGAYRLLRELGAGGMGTVWLAERADGAFRRNVALKLPHVTWLGGLAERMARERDILAGLEHPNIARLYDAGVDQLGRPFMAMEYIEGLPIDRYGAERGLSNRAKLALMLDVARAVSHAHARLVVHRDLKPANILVSADGVVHLLDFGIARLLESGLVEDRFTRSAAHPLTPDYASPEQLRGNALGTGSDVFSLGVILFELLTGKLPWNGVRAADTEVPVASSQVADESRRRELRGDLDSIVGKALKADPAERYLTADALAQDIERHLAGLPVHARPDSTTYRLGKLLRRNRTAAVALAAVITSLIVGTALALWQAREALEHAALAERQAARAESVKRFALSIFEDADYDAGNNTSTTALDLLARAQERIDIELADDPAIAVELMTSVGYSLIGLDQLAKAPDLLRRAVELGETRLGPDDPLTAAARVTYAEALVANARLPEAEEQLHLAIADARRLDAPRTLADGLRRLSDLRVKQGREAESEPLADEAVQVAETRLAPGEPRLRMELYINQYTVWRAGMRADSVVPAKKAYELARELDRGKPSLSGLVARLQYASALGDNGDFASSVRELEAVVGQMTKLTGPDNRLTAIATSRLGGAQVAHGHVDVGLAAMRKALQPYSRPPLSAMTRDVGVMRMQLGSALVNAGRFDEGLRELDGALPTLIAGVGEQSTATQMARSQRALALARLGRHSDAQAELDRIQGREKARPLERAELDARQAMVWSLAGRHREASQLFKQALEVLETQQLGGSRLSFARVLAAAAESARELDNRARVREYLERSVAILQALQHPGSAELQRVRHALEQGN
jgi:serine/threonine-protein kinase